MRAYCVILKPEGRTGKRSTLVGFASGELVEDKGETAVVDIDKVSGPILERRIELPRVHVYYTREERAYFYHYVGWILEGKPCGPRPKIEKKQLELFNG